MLCVDIFLKHYFFKTCIRAPADREASIKDSGFTSNSPVSAHCYLTRKKPLLGRDSLGQEQREIPALVWEWTNENRECGLLGIDSLEREQREVPGLVQID